MTQINHSLFAEEVYAALGRKVYISIKSIGGDAYEIVVKEVDKSDLSPSDQATVDSVWASHDASQLSVKEIRDFDIQNTKESALTAATSIPGWAVWDETTALSYIDTNVTDLNSAITVLKALTRLIITLRDDRWPHLTVDGE